MLPQHAAINDQLNNWIGRIAKIGRSIETLNQHPAFLRLKTQGRLGSLHGETMKRAEKIIAITDELWRFYLVLDKTLIDAAQLRNSNNPFTLESRYAQIKHLICEPSINAGTVETPLAALQLDSATQPDLTLEDVYLTMDQSFRLARDTVAQAEEGWNAQNAFSSLADKISALETEAMALHFTKPPQIAEATRAIEDLLKEIDTDPLGAITAIDQVKNLVKQADTALAAARSDHAKATICLNEATARLANFVKSRENSQALRDLRLAKIAYPQPSMDLPKDPTPDLQIWLDRIKTVYNDGRAHAAIVGTLTWSEQIEAHEKRIAEITAQDKKMIDVRNDLRGHFTALKTRADDLASQGKLSVENAALLAQTASLLFGAATSLPEAVQLIRRCDRI